MTAEQALIEENKKDLRKKYITKDINGNTEFWSAKPFINYETGQWNAEGFLISIVLNDIEIDFSRKDWQECILCIDDIKQEIPPIGNQWYIECTEENRGILDSWRLKNANEHLGFPLRIGHIVLSKNLNDNSLFHLNYDKCFPSDDYIDYQEITLEQFKKYVLCEGEEKQEEKRIENHPIMSIAESELFQKEKLFVKNDTSIKIEQTIFYSTRCWIEDRINYINKFIGKNIDSDLCIPIEWVDERNELVEKLKNL